jgi:hypothetical protein
MAEKAALLQVLKQAHASDVCSWLLPPLRVLPKPTPSRAIAASSIVILQAALKSLQLQPMHKQYILSSN